jgi:hypothetical protein
VNDLREIGYEEIFYCHRAGHDDCDAGIRRDPHHQAGQSTRQLYMYAPQGAGGARAAAMQECNAIAAKFSNSAWETAQLAAYGTCMTEHGQQP